MACNCLCCGCQNCSEGQEGKCCCGGPSGECCQPGYFCCDGVCLEGGCEGACCVDGECSITSQEDCAGVWQGPNTTCEDGDCADLCCVPEGSCGSDAYYQCREGYFEGLCESLNGTTSETCDPSETHPGTGSPLCADGGPTQVTVTVSGATASPADFQPVADACNATFILDLDCSLSQTNTLVDQVAVTVNGVTITHYIFISLSINANSKSVSVTMTANTANPPGSPPAAFGSSINRQELNHLSVAYTNCAGLEVADCSGYALSAGNDSYVNGTNVDFSAATIGLS